MSQEELNLIKKRATLIRKIITLIVSLGIILFLIGLVVLVLLFFASPERFTADRGNLNWHISYNLTANSAFFMDIPFKFMQSSDSSRFSAKHAMIVCVISLGIKELLILYGLNQISKILSFTFNEIPPFTLDNVNRLKKLAYTIIIYYLAADMLSNILYTIFVTKIFVLNLSHIHLSGVLIGGLILVIADIFNYGFYIQTKYDSTL